MNDFESPSLIDMVTSELLTADLALTQDTTVGLSEMMDLTMFGTMPFEPLDLSPWDFPSEPFSMMNEPPAAIVPESHAWIPLMGMSGILFSKRRRRPYKNLLNSMGLRECDKFSSFSKEGTLGYLGYLSIDIESIYRLP